MQLFSTVSVQYVPAWSKETVALLRKVSAHSAWSAGWRTRGAGRAAWSTWLGTASSQGLLGHVSVSAWAPCLARPWAPCLVVAPPV